jgi:hypothetical protein
MSQNFGRAIAVIGIDIGKNSFHIVGLDERGAIALRQKWSRGQVEARLLPCSKMASSRSRRRRTLLSRGLLMMSVDGTSRTWEVPDLSPQSAPKRTLIRSLPRCAILCTLLGEQGAVAF